MPRISRDTDIYPISLRELEVLRVEDITPAMRRVTTHVTVNRFPPWSATDSTTMSG